MAEPTLTGFKNRHDGESIVVCGCGPSLNELPPQQRLLTIGVNDVGRLFDPTYLVVVNPRSQFKNDRFAHVERSKAQALFTQLDLGLLRPPVVRFKLGQFGGTDAGNGSTLHYTQNSPYVAVCLAALMGARRIGLIGVDFTDDHFFAATGRHVLSSRLKEIDAQYGRLAAALEGRGVELVNLSARSRLTSLPKLAVQDWRAATLQPAHSVLAEAASTGLRIVSYATTPVAGVPALLARCIAHATPHNAQCVWAGGDYGNGVAFEGGVDWRRQPRDALALMSAADVVIVHNGRIAPAHQKLLAHKPLVTMAHNYGWNVDMQHVRCGHPGVVVGQYQATLPEFAGWSIVPNPIPLWEADHTPQPKGEVIRIAYTPSGRYERYPANHRLYWHGKGFETTMTVLRKLARLPGVCIETTEAGQMSHAQSLAAKRRAHIVIDECVTGSYHRNSLEGLAAGCVVINGVGLLAGVEEALGRCAPGAQRMPFEFSRLDALEDTLMGLIASGPEALAARGRLNREWMERHWNFADQWPLFWKAACDARPPQAPTPARVAVARGQAPRVQPPARPVQRPPVPLFSKKDLSMEPQAIEAVSVVVPHGGTERLPHLMATLATLRQRAGIGEIIVCEMGRTPVAQECASRWANKHLFVHHDGPFERARALNAAQAVAECSLVLWHDNDLLMPPDFVLRAVRELRERGLDYLTPYTSVRYLSPADSLRVMQGQQDPSRCQPQHVLKSAMTAFGGGMGLVSRDFLKRHGGFIEGFRGWGGEDNAWNHKVAVLGRGARSTRSDQHVHHLYHPSSGGHEQGAAGFANPHYNDNVALMRRVCAIRQPAELVRQFPAAVGAAGELTLFNTLRTAEQAAPCPSQPTVWTYWEGPCPAWIEACLRTLSASAPHVRVLTAESFDRLRDQDRDIDLSRLQVAHRADYIRMFLLQRYGGLWVDADCLAMQSLKPVLDLLAEHDMVGHRERSGLVSNGFVASRAGGRIVSLVYRRICGVLRSRRPLGWTSIGSEPLSAVIAEDATGWHGLPCERVQPICWSQPEAFFAKRTAAEHAQAIDPQALCYMLSNTQIRQHTSQHPQEDLLKASTFFSHLLQHAVNAGVAEAAPYEQVFTRHAEIYSQYNDESISGPGSSCGQTAELRERLPLLCAHLGIRSLLDAPCGDFNWMQHTRLGLDSYTGVDILSKVVAELQQRHGRPPRHFVWKNLIEDDLPQADAILCRDLLPHLTYAEIWSVLRNFKRSGALYLITTTFSGPRLNHDTLGGDWRALSLTGAPFHLPPPLMLIDERCTEGGGAFKDKSIGVWCLADLMLTVGSQDLCTPHDRQRKASTPRPVVAEPSA